eukprot:scaffold13893_cov234-Alexandrium_tamarense.AAC.2
MYCINTNQSQQQQQQQQVSKEGDTFEVPIEVAKLSNLVVTTLGEEDDDDYDDDDDNMVEIPLPNVKSSVLAKVIEYCTHYNQDPMCFGHLTNLSTMPLPQQTTTNSDTNHNPSKIKPHRGNSPRVVCTLCRRGADFTI